MILMLLFYWQVTVHLQKRTLLRFTEISLLTILESLILKHRITKLWKSSSNVCSEIVTIAREWSEMVGSNRKVVTRPVHDWRYLGTYLTSLFKSFAQSIRKVSIALTLRPPCLRTKEPHIAHKMLNLLKCSALKRILKNSDWAMPGKQG